MTLSVKFWGVRGSIACPSANHIKYGGNTSCIEVRAGKHRLVLDAGTGIRGGSVAGRVNSLLEKKVLAESLNRKCKISGMTVNTIRVYLNKQSELF